MSHIFISYSRQDQDYVTRLAQALEFHRLPLWLDDRINYGSKWPREIQKHLDACLVFVLVMSPRSRESDWVNHELTRAIRLRKPIFPLWLEGDIWLEVESYQAVDVRHRDVPPDRFFNDLRPYFPAPVATADFITLQDVVADGLELSQTRPVGWAPPTIPTSPPTPKSATAPTAEEDDLSSEKGIDYTRLRDLLKAQDWRAADQETYEVMIRAVGKKKDDGLTSNEIRSFPCIDLQTLNGLWMKHSQEKFGFSSQRAIWESLGSPTFFNDDWEKMLKTIGWKTKGGFLNKSRFKVYDELTFSKAAPKGHFWAQIMRSWRNLGFYRDLKSGRLIDLGSTSTWDIDVASGIFSRSKSCEIKT